MELVPIWTVLLRFPMLNGDKKYIECLNTEQPKSKLCRNPNRREFRFQITFWAFKLNARRLKAVYVLAWFGFKLFAFGFQTASKIPNCLQWNLVNCLNTEPVWYSDIPCINFVKKVKLSRIVPKIIIFMLQRI